MHMSAFGGKADMIAVRITARGDRCRNQKGPFPSYLNLSDNAFRILADRTCESASVAARFLRHYVHEPHSGFAEWAFWSFDFLQRQFGHTVGLRHRGLPPFGRPYLKESADVGYKKFKYGVGFHH